MSYLSKKFSLTNTMFEVFDDNSFSQRFGKHYHWSLHLITFSTIYNKVLFFKIFHWHTRFQGFWVFRCNSFSQRSRKYHHWIELFKTFSTIYNMSYFSKEFLGSYQALGLISGFLWFFNGKVSVDVFKNIIIDQHFSRRFQRYIILFCSSKIHWFLDLYMPWEN